MLLEYLQDYTDRVKPLLDQNELFGKIQTEFEKKWENGTFPGWPVSPCECVCVCDRFSMNHLCKVITEVKSDSKVRSCVSQRCNLMLT